MERVFKAKKEMYFDLMDDDGFLIEEDEFIVPQGSLWYWYYDDKQGVLSSPQLISEDLKQCLEIVIDVLGSDRRE